MTKVFLGVVFIVAMAKLGYILLVDAPAEKTTAYIAGLVTRSSAIIAQKGELLNAIPDDETRVRDYGKKPHNFRLVNDPAVTLYAGEEGRTQLDTNDFLLLEAIESCRARYEAFLNWKIKWGLSLHTSSMVYVNMTGIPGKAENNRVLATIQYIGAVIGIPGILFGVEILDKNTWGYGTTDGTFQGRRYFYCKDNCGLFVSLDKISADAKDNVSTQPEENQFKSHHYDSRMQAREGASGGRIESSVDRVKLGVGNRVVVYNRRNFAIHGTVRWVGSVSDGKNESISAVGIETDVAVQKTDFSDAIALKKQPFKVRDGKHGKLYLPEEFVISEEEAADKKGHRKVHGVHGRKNGHLKHGESSVLAKQPNEPMSLTAEHELIHRQDQSQLKGSVPLQHPESQVTPSQSQGGQHLQSQGTAPHPQAKVNPPPVAMVSPSQEGNVCLHTDLGIGSTVQVSDPPLYGVIRWVGDLPRVLGKNAGVELEMNMKGCTDGTFHGTRYFTCPNKRGFFCSLNILKPDQRFAIPGTTPGERALMNPLVDFPMEEPVDQTIGENQIKKYLGERRGIQGHQNSCYLDATVFGLFALSDVFDDMFLKEPDSPAGKEVSTLLWKGIVNPLRKNGVVRHESVMSMRNKLEELGKMKGVNLDEKDPEEFLNMLFKHALDVDPFITIKRPFGVEKEFFVQLFLEFDEEMKLPTVGDLLVKMFKEQHISFTRVPSKLMIQVPRYGKQFKTFKRIIPNLSLDVTTLTDSPYQCTTCGESAWHKCSACTAEFKSNDTEDPHHVYFCDDCNKKVHSACDRSNHQLDRAILNEGNVTELELLSVICIETSHYVCFALKDERWLFFDSMANQVYDTYNIPKGVDCTDELNEWVYCGDRQRLLTTPPRQIPEYVRRFTQDVYMCVYIQPD